jgi:hypothetical protein
VIARAISGMRIEQVYDGLRVHVAKWSRCAPYTSFGLVSSERI